MSIVDFLEKILPNLEEEEKPGEIRDYTLKYLACRLCGHVMNRFSIWTGSGGNGKSILIDLVRKTLGGYCMNLPVTILTQKRKSSNAACPEKARTRGARLCYMQEPDENETINAGEMKELSGGDMILARNLYQEPFEFKPQWELVLMCNDKPKIEDKTNGAWRRVSVSPFNSRFVDKDDEIDETRNVYKADKKLQEKVNDWGVVFMGILLNLWCSEDCQNINVPQSIRAETLNYKNQNDYIGQWMSEKCEEDSEDTIPFRDLNSSYQNWLDLVYGKNIKVDIQALKERLVSWQKFKFGFVDGLNGTITNPKVNIKLKSED
jgi:P4 family phage/plasmid primase-like protien